VKFVTFEADSHRHIGVLDGEAVYDLTAADDSLDDLVDLIASGDRWRLRVEAALADAPRRLLGEVQLLAPIPRPRKDIAAVGRNYREHAREFSASGFDASETKSVPDHPIFFTKAPTSVVGPDDAIDTANDPTSTTDYEGELGVVIGRPGIRIARDEAMDHVFGYTAINDVTARDLQTRHVQWHIGKSPDTFCPMGPCLVTADEIPDIGAAWLRTRVNGELRQEAPVAELIFDIPVLIETLSSVMTLEPGDVMATGTPMGVGIGFDLPVYLMAGDVVEVEIDGIGVLRNPVI
jgi:2-keto-4-pentenoate hydratase/2-oxohepta-3-ene-1,7-dioic acid hydratase in catechol pathway